MPGRLSITVGIPGSGKTTEAEARAKADPNVVLMSRDDFRHLLYRGEGILSSDKEMHITKVMEREAKDLLRKDKHVIVHDMNLREKYRKQWAIVAWSEGAEIEVIDLTSVELPVCLQRTQRRRLDGGRDVPQDVVRELHRKFIKPLKGAPVKAPERAVDSLIDYTPYEYTTGLPEAIIVDIDGTVADCTGVRSPYDESKYALDNPHIDVIQFVQQLHYTCGYRVIFVSGRHEDYEDVTEEWLYSHVKVPIEGLYMRYEEGTEDSIIKVNLFNKHIRGKYNIVGVFDDRNRVVQAWRRLGIRVYQVQDGDF